jgi:hypothetical protein
MNTDINDLPDWQKEWFKIRKMNLIEINLLSGES